MIKGGSGAEWDDRKSVDRRRREGRRKWKWKLMEVRKRRWQRVPKMGKRSRWREKDQEMGCQRGENGKRFFDVLWHSNKNNHILECYKNAFSLVCVHHIVESRFLSQLVTMSDGLLHFTTCSHFQFWWIQIAPFSFWLVIGMLGLIWNRWVCQNISALYLKKHTFT